MTSPLLLMEHLCRRRRAACVAGELPPRNPIQLLCVGSGLRNGPDGRRPAQHSTTNSRQQGRRRNLSSCQLSATLNSAPRGVQTTQKPAPYRRLVAQGGGRPAWRALESLRAFHCCLSIRWRPGRASSQSTSEKHCRRRDSMRDTRRSCRFVSEPSMHTTFARRA